MQQFDRIWRQILEAHACLSRKFSTSPGPLVAFSQQWHGFAPWWVFQVFRPCASILADDRCKNPCSWIFVASTWGHCWRWIFLHRWRGGRWSTLLFYGRFYNPQSLWTDSAPLVVDSNMFKLVEGSVLSLRIISSKSRRIGYCASRSWTTSLPASSYVHNYSYVFKAY